MTKNQLLKTVFLAFIFIANQSPPNASAVNTQAPPSGITVAPASVTVQVGSLQPQSSVTIGIRNNFDTPVTITPAISGLDIRNNSLLPSNTPETALSSFISFTPTELDIPPGGSKNVTATVTNSAALAPGGRYVSLLLTQVTARPNTGVSQLGLTAAVSAAVYIIKEDGAVRDVALTKLQIDTNVFKFPSKANVTIRNTGNITAVPRGTILINDQGAQNTYSQAVINQPSVPVYPNSAIVLQSQFETLERSFWPRRYDVIVSYRYDGQDDAKTQAVSFFHVPWWWPVTFVLLALIGIVLRKSKNRKRIRQLLTFIKLKLSPKKQLKPFKMPENRPAKSAEKALPKKLSRM